MIKNIWSIIRFYCMDEYEKPEKMQFVYENNSAYYECPKADCRNRLKFEEAEKIAEHLSKVIIKEEANGIQANLKNYKWKSGSIDVIVLEYTNEKIKLGVLNRKIV